MKNQELKAIIKDRQSFLTVQEIREDIKRKGLLNKMEIVLLLNTGHYMATGNKNCNEVKIALNKYDAINITDLVLSNK